MKELAEKLRLVEQELSAERGRFEVFALLLREDAPDVWDVVVAAPWASRDRFGAIQAVANKIQKELTPEELTKLSRVVVLEKANSGLTAFHQAFSIEHGLTELNNISLFGIPVKRGYVITSRRDQPPNQSVAG